MVLPGHLAGGYLVTRIILAITHAVFTPAQTLALLIIGTLAGEGPDIDLIWYSFSHIVLKSKKNDDHREFITHAPLVWLIGSLIVVAIGALIGSLFIEYIGWLILAGSWTHFILDSIEYGIMWLWPWSHKRYALRLAASDNSNEPADEKAGTISGYWRFITKRYIHYWSFWLEIILTCVAIYAAFH